MTDSVEFHLSPVLLSKKKKKKQEVLLPFCVLGNSLLQSHLLDMTYVKLMDDPLIYL